MINAHANLLAVLTGFFRRTIQAKNPINKGVSTTIKKGLIDWNNSVLPTLATPSGGHLSFGIFAK
jgi:hypothetical protein